MKKFLLVLVVVFSVFGLAACGDKDDKKNNNNNNNNTTNYDKQLDAKFNGFAKDKKVYLTTIGQGPEYETVFALLTSPTTGVGLSADSINKSNDLKAADVEEGSVVILVPGASNKGLTGSFNQASEENRANEFAARAQKGEIEIILIHNGGEGRRGTLSDQMITNAGKNASILLVLKSGYEIDGFFDNLASTNGASLYVFTGNPKLVPALKQIFDK